MDAVNQAAIRFAAQQENVPELNDRSRANANDLDFISILLKGSSDDAFTEKNQRDTYLQEVGLAKAHDDVLRIQKEVNKKNDLSTHLPIQIKMDYENGLLPKTSEKLTALALTKMHKNQVGGLHAGEFHSSTKKELYEQSAFAINKLSYLDVLRNVGGSTHQNEIKSITHISSHFDAPNDRAVIPNKISNNQQALLASIKVGNQSSEREVIENKIANSTKAQLGSNPHLIEKSRVMIASFKNEESLYIRDHFATTQQLDFTISNILRSVKYTFSKIFVNGKER